MRVAPGLGRVAAAVAGAALGLSAVGPAWPVAVPSVSSAAAEGTDCASAADPEVDLPAVTGDNQPYEDLHVAAAQEALDRPAGEGVTVAVVDSGAPLSFVDEQVLIAGGREIPSSDGSVAAGIIGGPDQDDVPIGFAPGARIVSVKAYDQGYDTADDEAVTPSSDSVAAALGWIRRELTGGGARVIAVVPLAVAASDGLEQEVRALDRAGALVVAASGDRPEEASRSPLERFALEEDEDYPPPGENANGHVWPADYPSVLSVGATPAEGADPTYPIRSTAIDVAAPAGQGVSYGASRQPCVLPYPSTAHAAAYVAGVAALVWSGRTGDTAAELRARLIRTADGSDVPGATSRLVGAGIVQPLAALERRDLPPGDEPRAEVAQRAEAPDPDADVLASTRRNAVWWGLGGGAVLVVALLLRPVLARRRSGGR